VGRNIDIVGGVAQAAANAGTAINRRDLRFLDGGGITWSVVDDPANNEVEVSAVAAGGGGSVPAGTMAPFAGTVAPAGWLLCDGSSYTTAGEPTLFAAIGYTWGGAGPNFNVPDMRRRVPVGSGGSGSGVLGNVVGNVGGAEAHALVEAEMPNHNHSHSLWGSVPWGTTFAAPFGGNGLMPTNFSGFTNINAGGSIGYTGGSGPHNNMQPSAVVMWIIKT
jgi:microcystin-dependent protein